MQAANMVLEATEWVQKTHPKIWQRRGGRDHIYLIPNDEGASERPARGKLAITLVHAGFTSAKLHECCLSTMCEFRLWFGTPLTD